MKILFISDCGDGLPMALKLQQEDNEVLVYIKNLKHDPEIYKGIVKIIQDWRSRISWCDFVVFDKNTELEEARRAVYFSKKSAFNACFCKKPIKLCGKTYEPYDFLLATEMERSWGHSILEHFDIGENIERFEFNDIEKASKFVSENRGKYVVKVEGDADSDSTYIGITDTGEDIVKYLSTYQLRPESKGVKKIELERKIDGIEIACGAYFNGKDFTAIDINFEHKKFLETPYSFLTGEMGTVIKLVDDHRLFRETVYKMGDFLREIDFRGNIDVSCIVNSDGLFPLEFTWGRFGYPAIYIEMEGHKSSWTDFLYSGASKTNHQLEYYPDWLIGVILAGQGYPFYKDVGSKKMKYMPVLVEDKETYDHMQFVDVRLIEDDLYTINAYIGCATSKGNTIEEARAKVYHDVLPKVKVPNTYYRTDIGERVISEHGQLEKLGYGL